MPKQKSTFVITPESSLGNCPEHPGEIVTIWETVSYLQGKTLRAGCCTACIEELKRSLKRKGARVVDRRAAANN
jgi:hypothetical protein